MIGKRLARIGAAPFLFFLAVSILVVVVADAGRGPRAAARLRDGEACRVELVSVRWFEAASVPEVTP